MKIPSTLILLLLSINSFAQQTQNIKTLELKATIIVIDLNVVSQKINQLFAVENVTADFYEEGKERIGTTFYLSDTAFYQFRANIDDWGYIKEKTSTSIDYNFELADTEKDIRETKRKIEKYKVLLDGISTDHHNHYKFWTELERLENLLHRLEDEKINFINKNGEFKVNLTVIEETITSTDEQRPDFSLINMPGIQYSYLWIENPIASFTPNSMQGVSVKYLINRRKTAIELGLYKPSFIDDTPVDGYNDMYLLGLSQDFYSSHFGRGGRKFMNLYSSAKTGAMILSTDDSRLFSWYATPSIGVELFKTKNILLDNKVGYFLPFRENRNMRGLLYEVSFNVVF